MIRKGFQQVYKVVWSNNISISNHLMWLSTINRYGLKNVRFLFRPHDLFICKSHDCVRKCKDNKRFFVFFCDFKSTFLWFQIRFFVSWCKYTKRFYWFFSDFKSAFLWFQIRFFGISIPKGSIKHYASTKRKSTPKSCALLL